VSRAPFKQICQDLIEVLPTLLERNMDEALKTLEWATFQAKTKAHFNLLLEKVILKLPRALFLENSALARVWAHVACRARELETLETVLEGWQDRLTPELCVYQAWTLNFRMKPAEGLALLEGIPETLPKWETGFALRMQGECRAKLEQPKEVWQPFFERARLFFEGVSLGHCMSSEGAYLYKMGEPQQARRRWAEALPFIREDIYYSAWWRYNLGITYFEEHDFIQSERHFTELERLTSRQEAAQFRACAFNGFGMVRRKLGEFDRALTCYTRAVKYARCGLGDFEDLETALWGTSFTLRLQGKSDDALGYMLEAYGVRKNAKLLDEIAVCCLLMGDLKEARHYLELSRTLSPTSKNLCALVQAEMARLEKDETTLKAALDHIDFCHPRVAEEVACFSELFKAALERGYAADFRRSSPQNTVRVRAEGTLQVWVNEREVSLKSTGLPAQLLVCLLEQGGRATLGDLATALFEERATQRERARKALHPHAVKLRETLGWEASVQANNGIYALDPLADWRYDIAELRVQNKRPRDFMGGVGKNWVLDTLAELENLKQIDSD